MCYILYGCAPKLEWGGYVIHVYYMSVQRKYYSIKEERMCESKCNCHVGRCLNESYPKRDINEVIAEAIMDSFEGGDSFDEMSVEEHEYVMNRLNPGFRNIVLKGTKH